MQKNRPIHKNVFTGRLMGLATGDTLCTTLTFNPPGTFDSIIDIMASVIYLPASGQMIAMAKSLVPIIDIELSARDVF